MKNLSLPQRIGAALLLSLLAVAFLQPYFYPIDTSFQDLGNILASGSEDNWFGTDHLGRDMFARLAAAVRLSFGLSLFSVACALLAGLISGVLAGFFGGWIDRSFSFICDLVMALPGLLLILLFAALSPGSFWTLYLGIALVMWVEFFRVIRAVCQTLAHRPRLNPHVLWAWACSTNSNDIFCHACCHLSLPSAPLRSVMRF